MNPFDAENDADIVSDFGDMCVMTGCFKLHVVPMTSHRLLYQQWPPQQRLFDFTAPSGYGVHPPRQLKPP